LILTVTPDPVLDRVYLIPEWTPGIPVKSQRSALSVGGKGLDASVALRHLGQETTALTFLAGRTGADLAGLVEAYGIDLQAVPAGGETRTALIISEEKHSRHTHIFSGGLSISPAQLEQFFDLFDRYLPLCSAVICGGIIPQDLPLDFYGQLIGRARQHGKPVLVDAFKDFMKGALPAQPEVVKMNLQEFEWTFARQANDLPALFEQAQAVLQEHSLRNLVVTCGQEGMLACTPQGHYFARGPKLAAINAAGAGDAASGAIAWRRSLGESWEQTLRWAAAVGAAVVLTEGTADLHLEDMQRILPQIEVIQIG
jgi:1-phosphofructokinase family hexose kinase